MIIKQRSDAAEYGVQPVDVESILIELLDWQEEYGEEDPVRYSMINSFEDIILNSIVGEG